MAAEESWLTIAELVVRLGISETGVHNWRKAGRDRVVSRTGSDGRVRYALSVFERIAVLRERGVPLARIRDALGEPEPAEPEPGADERKMALLERIAVALERIADRLNREDG